MHHNKKNSLAFWNWGFIKAIIDFFFPPIKTHFSGKLVVSGEGSLEFSLEDCPDNVFVYFEDEQEQFPCDPGEDDCLDWHVVETDCHCKLVLEWNVSGTRTIAWKVC